MWTLPEAITFVRYLEDQLRPNYHAALAGGVLQAGSSDKDIDVIVFPHSSAELSHSEIESRLRKADLVQIRTGQEVRRGWRDRRSTDQKWVEHWAYHGKRVDIFILT